MLTEKKIPFHHYFTEDFHAQTDELEHGESGLKHITENNFLGTLLGTEGWKTAHFIGKDIFPGLKKLITQHVKSLLEAHQIVSDDFTLDNYHRHVLSDQIHYTVSSWAMSQDVIAGYYSHIKSYMEDFIGCQLNIKEIEHKGNRGHFLGFRIVRPMKTDHNPYHRDAWLSYWRDTVNVWIPICGFDNGNTISLIPGTHTLDDNEIIKTKQGAIIGDKTYHVPEAVATTIPLEKTNPNLSLGEGLIFSPYLLHGNGKNNLPDTTRVSIELRFCKAE